MGCCNQDKCCDGVSGKVSLRKWVVLGALVLFAAVIFFNWQ
ncbi:hypothetical protein [Vibrio aerogenes]|nr:hypothetical protein [Vibrio aerogenes]